MSPFGKFERAGGEEETPETTPVSPEESEPSRLHGREGGKSGIVGKIGGRVSEGKAPDLPEIHGSIGRGDKSEKEPTGEIFEGMTLVNRDRGNVWVVESITETSPGKAMVILRSKDDERSSVSKRYSALVEALETDGGAWRRE